MATNPERVGPVYGKVQGVLRQEAGISIHVGKTEIWNQAGVRAISWNGQPVTEVPPEEQGIKMLGTPIGHPEHVRRFLVRLTDEHQTLLNPHAPRW